MHGRSIRERVTPITALDNHINQRRRAVTSSSPRHPQGTQLTAKLAGWDRELTAVAACIAITAALLIYQPYSARPFDMRDFSEFVPLLKGHDSAFVQFEKMTSYYGSRGRANLIP